MKKISLVLVNLSVLVGLIVAANIASYLALLWMPLPDTASTRVNDDPRLRYPNVASLPWAPVHFRELDRLEMEYHSFVGWRRKPFAGQTIKIGDNGLRLTTGQSDKAPAVVGLFGGSTMWGTGARDEDTIASQMNRDGAGKIRAINYGETGYRAHQSFNLLAGEYFAGNRFTHVLFYDGVNDVYSGCKSDGPVYSHFFDRQYREIIDYFNDSVRVTAGGRPTASRPAATILVQPIVDLLDRLAGRTARSILNRDRVASIVNVATSFDCDRNPQRAENVAKMLVDGWVLADDLAKRTGAKFTAVLQPVAYFTKSNVAHLGLDNDWNAGARLHAQYEAVYPIIRKLAQEAAAQGRLRFIDLSDQLNDPGQSYYFDFCHITPNGNAIIARSISAALN